MRLPRLFIVVVILIVLSLAVSYSPSPSSSFSSSPSSSSSSSSHSENRNSFGDNILLPAKQASPEDQEDDDFFSQSPHPNSPTRTNPKFLPCDHLAKEYDDHVAKEYDDHVVKVRFVGTLTLAEPLGLAVAFLDHYLRMGIPPSCVEIVLQDGKLLDSGDDKVRSDRSKKAEAIREVLRERGIQGFDPYRLPSEAGKDIEPGTWEIQARSVEFHEYPLPLYDFLASLQKAKIDRTKGDLVDRVEKSGRLLDVEKGGFRQDDFDLACEVLLYLGTQDQKPGPVRHNVATHVAISPTSRVPRVARIRIHNFRWTADLVSQESQESHGADDVEAVKFLEKNSGKVPVQEGELNCKPVSSLARLVTSRSRRPAPNMIRESRRKPGHMDFEDPAAHEKERNSAAHEKERNSPDRHKEREGLDHRDPKRPRIQENQRLNKKFTRRTG